jgi:hypothetical protein
MRPCRSKRKAATQGTFDANPMGFAKQVDQDACFGSIALLCSSKLRCHTLADGTRPAIITKRLETKLRRKPHTCKLTNSKETLVRKVPNRCAGSHLLAACQGCASMQCHNCADKTPPFSKCKRNHEANMEQVQSRPRQYCFPPLIRSMLMLSQQRSSAKARSHKTCEKASGFPQRLPPPRSPSP